MLISRSSLRSWFRLGIRQKMALILVTVLTVALGTTSWLTVRQHESNILRETQRHGMDLARIVAQSLSYSVIGYDYNTIQQLLNEIIRTHKLGYARVLSAKQNVMAEAGKPPRTGSDWTMFTQAIIFDGKKVGELLIGYDNRGIISRLAAEKSSFLSREAVIIILIVIGEFLALSYIIVRPVSIISNALDKGVDTFGTILHQIPLTSGDEFGRLAIQFNNLRDQLNEANARLQSKIESADAKLSESNHKLTLQAEELQRINSELETLAITDPLTGLYNRRYFERVTRSDLALSARHGDINSILIIDVDHFKRVNDTYGHKIGDHVLIEISRLIAKSLRRSDLVCRMGGEEFIVLCRRTECDESIRIGEKIRHAIASRSFQVAEGTWAPVTVSIGVVTFPIGKDEKAIEDYIAQADLALYRSKSMGRNCVTHFGGDLNQPATA